MKRMKKSIIAGLLIAGLLISANTYAAQDTPVQLAAQTIEYDASQKIVQAIGDVKITQEGTTLTGPNAEYRNETGIAVMTGGITLSSETVRVTGGKLDYNTNTGIGIVSGQPRMDDKDGAWMTGATIEYNSKIDQAVVSGRVHVVHSGRQIDATADRATYYGKERKIVLSGNARALQDGNSLVGETLTVYMDSKVMDAQGQTKLIIVPNDRQ